MSMPSEGGAEEVWEPFWEQNPLKMTSKIYLKIDVEKVWTIMRNRIENIMPTQEPK